MATLELELPYPPSLNDYWRHVGAKTLISREGRKYRERIAGAVRGLPRLNGRLTLIMDVYPPDRRRRDLDNLFKSLLDSLQKANVYQDDNQIKHIEADMREPMEPDGMVYVRLIEQDSQTQGKLI